MTPSGIEPANFRLVAQHLNHCATAICDPIRLTNVLKYIKTVFIQVDAFGLTSYKFEQKHHDVLRVKRERESQQDVTIRCLLSTSVSTCFGHHYAHLQENKDRVLLHMVYCSGSAGCGW